ncbi:class I SAM-dependent methyltransferase [Nanoarchaeota archaeon]
MNPVQMFYTNNYFKELKETEPFKEYLDKEEEIIKQVVKGGKCLDVGCSNGLRSTRILSDICDSVIGIDFSYTAIKDAKRNFKDIIFFYEDAKSTHFSDNSFDYVVMSWNLFGNLYSSRDLVLAEAKRIVKDNGLIVISTFSENVLEPYKELVSVNGLNIDHIDENYAFLREGLVSERFSESKLRDIFSKFDLDADIAKLTDIAYFCEVRK